MSCNSHIYDLSQLAGPSPWPSAPVDVWEDWYRRLQTEEALLNTGDIPSNEYELDGLAKVRTAMTHAEHKIFNARKLAEEKLQDEKDWDEIHDLIKNKVELEERADRMMSETENLLLQGLPGTDKDPQDDLKPWTPSWYPGTGHCSEIEIDFPASYLYYSDGARFKEVTYDLNRGGQCVPTAPEVGKGKYTYVPDGTLFAGLKLPAWGSQHGPRETREAWVARDIIGHSVLIRVKRIAPPNPIPGTLHTPLDETEHELSNFILEFYNDVYEFPDELTGNNFRYEWLFALVNSYDASSGKHSIKFRLDDVPVTGICVDLEKCIFQEWTRPDLRTLKAKNIL